MERQAYTPLCPCYGFLLILILFLTGIMDATGQTELIRPLTPLPPGGSVDRELPDSLVAGVIADPGGSLIEVISVPGPPPSPLKSATVASAAASATAVVLSGMPAYIWSFGCSPTAGAMIAAYYDNHGYPNLYTGPANGGAAPLDNLGWGTATISGQVRNLCPISATRLGLDNRSTRGHVDDYWISYGSSATDPYITNNWTEHAPYDCVADFMGTNQSEVPNQDGSTRFYYYVGNSAYAGTNEGDGGYGFELFFESRGYQVVRRFNQYISGYNNLTAGFTFDQYKAEIDAGRPVMVHVMGHSMAGYGYDTVGNLVYVRDTWDLSDHTFPWGGSYEGMQHYAVSVLELEPPDLPVLTDLAPSLIVTPNVMNGSANFEVIVKVAELGGTAALDTVTVAIPRDARWNLDGPFTPSLTSLSGVPLNNNLWTYDPNNPAYHIFRKNGGLAAGTLSSLGFKARFNPGSAKGVSTMTVQILPGKGGETATTNNSDSEKLDYFAK